MADTRHLLVLSNNVPVLGAVGTFTVTAFAAAGGARTPPTLVEVGEGVYRFTVTDADETVGTVVHIDLGAGRQPRRATFACFLPTRANQFWAVHVENPDGSAWTGPGIPSVGSYKDAAGARSAPFPVTLAPHLYSLIPTAADMAADVEIRIDGPAGSAQPFWLGQTQPVQEVSPWAAPSPGPVKNPALDVANFLDTKTAGATLLTKGTNLFVGPVRSYPRTTAPAVFVLNTGGPSPELYVGGHRAALLRPSVQVIIRGPPGDVEAGEELARGVFGWLHMQVVTGYVSLYARDSAPVFLGDDADQHPQWALNVECHFKAELSP